MSKKTPKIKKNTAQKVSAVVRSRVKSETEFVRAPLLYRFVYSSKISLTVAFVLLTSFLLQGIETTYAAEETVTGAVAEEEVVSTEEAVSEPEEVLIENEEETEQTEVEIVAEPEELLETEIVAESEPTETSETETAAITTEASDDTTVLDDNESDADDAQDGSVDESDEGEVNDSVEGSVTDSAEDETVSGNEDDSADNTPEETADADVPLEDDEGVATSTEVSEEVEVTENTFETISSVQSDSAFSFTKDQCTQLATGSFYCLEPQTNTLADALFAAQDAEGDMEIYFIRNNEQVQITNNSVDDAAPYFDQNTNTIVWHRLLDDRFQIISYDVEEAEEQQITRTAENNMEPTRQGEYTVWQRWVDGGWNIILFDGATEKQLTKTTSHNVAPYIHGTLVVWNRQTAGGTKTIEMYDITTDTYVTIDDPDGLSVSNPRMVFVYDSLHPNGDIVTKGYDVLAKKFIELDTLPRNLPEEIPNSDSTGETRALIQSKPSLKSEVEEVTTGTGSTTPELPPEPAIASSTEALTLDLSTAVETPPMEPLTEIESFDLVIPPLESAGTTSSEAV